MQEATGLPPRKTASGDGDMGEKAEAVVLGSGNLGLVYLMEVTHRMTREEIDDRHPGLLAALAGHPHVGFVCVATDTGPVAVGAGGERHLTTGRVIGVDPLEPFPPGAERHLLRTDGFTNAPDILVNSFYDPELDDACAFEELISFHGGLGGPQSRPFIMCPVDFPLPVDPIVGAEAVHGVLLGWRRMLQPVATRPSAPAGQT